MSETQKMLLWRGDGKKGTREDHGCGVSPSPRRGYSPFCISLTWLLFRSATGGVATLLDSYAYIPGISALILAFLLVCPYDIFHKTERDKFILWEHFQT